MRSAILLVGGRGTRLAPLTNDTPKPFLRVGGVPFIDHQIAKAKAAGAAEIILATSYKSDVFRDYYQDGSKWNIPIKYAIEEVPLGTGGAIRNALKITDAKSEAIAIFNGDVLSGFDLGAQYQSITAKNAKASLYLTKVADARPYGVVLLDQAGMVVEFLEKMENPISNLINAGCYIFSKELKEEIIENYPDNKVISVEREIFPDLIKRSEKIYGYLDESYWLDMGTPATLVKASADLITGKVLSPALSSLNQIPTNQIPTNQNTKTELEMEKDWARRNVNGQYLLGERVEIHPSAKISGGSDIQSDVVIKDKVEVESSIIGQGVILNEEAKIVRSVVKKGSVVPAGVILIDNFYGFA